MVPLSSNTWSRVEILFDPGQRDAARELLENECADNLPFFAQADMFALERVRFAVLKLADGNLERLRRAIDQAKVDWRDTLMAADFGQDMRAHEYWLPSPPQR